MSVRVSNNPKAAHPSSGPLLDPGQRNDMLFNHALPKTSVLGTVAKELDQRWRDDNIQNGIVTAVKETGLKLPLVVRLEGNNVEAAKKTLAQSGLKLITGGSMADAAQKVVRAVGVG